MLFGSTFKITQVIIFSCYHNYLQYFFSKLKNNNKVIKYIFLSFFLYTNHLIKKEVKW